MNTFKYQDNSFHKHDFDNLTIGELMKGPYCIKFDCDAFPIPIYYAGIDDKMNAHLLAKGKFVISFSSLVDHMLHFSFWAGKDLIDSISAVSFKDLMDTIKYASDHLSKTSVFKDISKM